MNHLGPILGEIMKWLGERRFDRTALPMHCPALPSTVNRDPFKWIPVKLFFPTSTLDELRVAKLSFAPISFWFFAATCRWKKSLLWETSRNEMEWEEDEGEWVRELFVLHRFQQLQFSHKNGNKSSVNWRSNENLGAVPFGPEHHCQQQQGRVRLEQQQQHPSHSSFYDSHASVDGDDDDDDVRLCHSGKRLLSFDSCFSCSSISHSSLFISSRSPFKLRVVSFQALRVSAGNAKCCSRTDKIFLSFLRISIFWQWALNQVLETGVRTSQISHNLDFKWSKFPLVWCCSSVAWIFLLALFDHWGPFLV